MLGQELLLRVLPRSGNSIRLGLSGVPGVGKSTFIENFGVHLSEKGKRLAVLAIDPSSSVSGGAILGDKTRMQKLSTLDSVFIRPSPSSGSLGGVARKTREAMLLCEAAGYDTIIVETVGVGQSEIEVASMTDIYMLLMLPNAGDELQGIKKGILELADILCVNKADADKDKSGMTAAELKSVLHYLRPRTEGWEIPVLKISALEGQGLQEVEDAVNQLAQFLGSSQKGSAFYERRNRQALDWMDRLLKEGVLKVFADNPQITKKRVSLESDLLSGKTTPLLAAKELLSIAFEDQATDLD